MYPDEVSDETGEGTIGLLYKMHQDFLRGCLHKLG